MPSLKLIFWTLTIAIVLYGGLEYTLRQSVVMRQLYTPTLGTEYQPFEEAYHKLAIYQQSVDNLDCVIVGSSQVINGINTVTVSERYATHTGLPLNCFNMGLGSLSVYSMAHIAQIIIDDFQPTLLIVGISHRDFEQYEGDNYATQRQLPQTDWGQYKTGQWSSFGWLYDTLYLARYGQALNMDTLRAIGTWQIVKPHEAPDQYSPSVGYWLSTPRNHPLTTFEYHAVDPLNQQAVQSFNDLPTDDTTILILEMPLAPHQQDVVAGSIAAYRQQLTNLFEPLQTHERLQVWQHSLTFTPQDWTDTVHLHVRGAQRFSTWLGDSLAQTDFNALPPIPPIQTLPDIKLNIDPNTGLDDTILMLYQNHSPTLDYPTVILNPAAPTISMQAQRQSLGIAINHLITIPDFIDLDTIFDLMVVLENTHYEADLSLTPAEQTALTTWRTTKASSDFIQTGLGGLLITETWFTFLSNAERQQFGEDFSLIANWYHMGELKTYYLYRPK